VSVHRARISELSAGEIYSQNLADPAIFKKTTEKYGGFWTVADEYRDSKLDSDPLIWNPADNNEFATRNRINELLRINPDAIHPVTGKPGSPKLFYIKRGPLYPFGCYHLIKETQSQKKELLDTVNGRNIYGDEREKSIADHAYDTKRYYIASHLNPATEPKEKVKPNSFFGTLRRIKALKKAEYFDRYGVPVK